MAPQLPPNDHHPLCACAADRAGLARRSAGSVTARERKEQEYCKKKAVDHLRKNLQYMTNGRFVADKAVTQQVLTQNRGRKSKDQPPEKKAKKSEGTVFTEEDFRKFEREYFGTV
nr:PREDICTED: active regulator of SIRT1 [Apteryx mantelli mantelli]